MRRFYFTRNNFGDGENIPNGEVRLILEFQDTDPNTTEVYSNIDTNGLKLIEFGKLKIENDLKEQYLTLGSMDFVIADTKKNFRNYLYQLTTNKKGYGSFQVNKGSGFVEEFNGNIDTPSIVIKKKENTISFTLAPATEVLKSLYLHDPQNNFALNPLDLVFTETTFRGKKIVWYEPIKVKDLFIKIFQKIDPTITFLNRNTWKFNAFNGDTHANIENLTFEDLWIGGMQDYGSNFLSKVFGTYNNGIYNIKDLSELVKRLAFVFTSYVGMINGKTAVLKEKFNYDVSSAIALDENKIIEFDDTYDYNSVDAVRILSKRYVKDMNEKNKFLEISKDNKLFILPYDADLRGDNIIDEEIIIQTPTYFEGDLWDDYADVFVINNNNAYALYGAKVSDGFQNGIYLPLCGSVQGYLLWNFFQPQNLVPLARVKAKGTDYDFMKDIYYNGIGYNIVSLEKDFANNETEIVMLAIQYSPPVETNPEPTEPPNFNIYLPGGFLKDYTYHAKINYLELDYENKTEQTKDIIEIPKETRLEKIIVKTAIGWDGIQDFYITDNDPDTINDIKNKVKLDYVELENDDNTTEIPINKDYENGTTLQIYFKWQYQQLSKGSSSIILKILRKD